MVHIRVAAYSPQANGKCERIHRDIVAYFRKLPPREKREWDMHLPSFICAYRCMDHMSAGYSPFFLLYGRDPCFPMDTLLMYHGESDTKHQLNRWHRSWRQARANIREKNAKNREYHDKKATSEPLKVGDPVYVVHHNRQNKLDGKWLPHSRVEKQLGPYTFLVQDQINNRTVSYTHLTLPTTERV